MSDLFVFLYEVQKINKQAWEGNYLNMYQNNTGLICSSCDKDIREGGQCGRLTFTTRFLNTAQLQFWKQTRGLYGVKSAQSTETFQK